MANLRTPKNFEIYLKMVWLDASHKIRATSVDSKYGWINMVKMSSLELRTHHKSFCFLSKQEAEKEAPSPSGSYTHIPIYSHLCVCIKNTRKAPESSDCISTRQD